MLADRYYEREITINLEPVVPVTIENVQPLDLSTQSLSEVSYNQCQGIPIAMAAANNQMYMGTNKPQLSGGMGECNGNWAGSLMGGMRIRNNLMINGNWAFDDNVNAFGFGATFIFK